MRPPSPPSTLILYASTSGSTRLLVSEMLNRLGPKLSEAYDLGDDAPPPPLADRGLVVLATPTYGIGDCHSSWRARGADVLSDLPRGATVALLCLADARGHAKSFAGGLDALERLVAPRSPRLVGHVHAAAYDFEASPALRRHLFSGLVVEYRRDRREATRRALEWLDDCLAGAPREPGSALAPDRETEDALC
jgi:flavodoxin